MDAIEAVVQQVDGASVDAKLKSIASALRAIATEEKEQHEQDLTQGGGTIAAKARFGQALALDLLSYIRRWAVSTCSQMSLTSDTAIGSRVFDYITHIYL
jgi:hypothetical protein